jgi:hypothetical protein
MRERRILAPGASGAQLVLRVSRALAAVVRRVGRRGVVSVLALARRALSNTSAQDNRTCPPVRLSHRSHGLTTVVAPVSEAIDRFPLDRYEAYMAQSRARHASVVHGCKSDLGPTAKVFGLPEEARVSLLLVCRHADARAKSPEEGPWRGVAPI